MYLFKPSLEHIVAVKIVVSFWNRNDVRDLMRAFFFQNLSQNTNFHEFSTEWKNIENRIRENMLILSLPALLKEKIMSIIKPIGIQIFKWIKYHCIENSICTDLPLEFCWTPQGTLNRKKTAQILIKDEKLDFSKRYNIACIYCLEHDVVELHKTIGSDLHSFFDSSQGYSGFLIVIHWLKRKARNPTNFNMDYEHLFERCASDGEKEAAEYFLSRVTPTRREKMLVSTSKSLTNTDVLYFLLLQMDEEQQREVLKSNPLVVLQCFINWPLQSSFIEVAKCMWGFLPKQSFNYLLQLILAKSREGYEDFNYQKLFVCFWMESPDDFKSYVIDKECIYSYLIELEDTYLKLFLHNMTHMEKKELFFCKKGLNICKNWFSHEKWNLFGELIQECLLSEDEMFKFKYEFEDYLSNSLGDSFMRNKQRWDQLFALSSDSQYNKRECMEKREMHPSKKICYEE